MASNGSFENGMNDWSNYVSNGNPALIGKFGTHSGYKPVSEAFYNFFIQDISWIANHQYYYSLYAYTNSTEIQSIVSDINSRSEHIYGAITVNSGWVKASLIHKSLYTEERSISINYGATTADTYVDGIVVIDLTETFGGGNEPDKDWCDRHIEYFDSTTTIYK